VEPNAKYGMNLLRSAFRGDLTARGRKGGNRFADSEFFSVWTHLGSRGYIAAVETISIFAAKEQQITSLERTLPVYPDGLLRCGFVE
jgi:hypothetical protein